MFEAVIVAVALQAGDLSTKELERYYWDCDATFMKGELGGQDLMSCLAITDEFQARFASPEAFKQYWHKNKRQQWAKRGYKTANEYD